MQYLIIVIVFMVCLSVVLSLGRSGSVAKRVLVSTAARIDCFGTQNRHYSNDNDFRSVKSKPLKSTSTSPSDSGRDGAVNKNLKRKLERVASGDNREKSRNNTSKLNDRSASSREPKTFARQNLSGRRILDSERKVKHPNDWIRLPKNPPKNIFEEFTQEFRQVIRSREFVPAMELYARMKEANFNPRESVLTGLLSICQKKEHLINAIEIFADFLAAGITPNESAYMSLIRCYSDNGQIDEALELIEQMNERSLEPKLRTYHPVLEAVCKNNDFDGAIQIIKQMNTSNVVPRSEQLTMLLEVGAGSGALDIEMARKQIDDLLIAASMDLLGMETAEMRRVVRAFCNLTPQEIVDEGILVESREDLPGEILEIGDDLKSPILTAINTTFPNVPTLLTEMVCSPTVIDNTVPIGFDVYKDSVKFEPDIYTIASESEALGGKEALGLRNRRARLVDISQRSCLCPNCGGKLVPLLLDEEERKRVRLGLMKIASTTSMNQLRNIQAYGEWLKLQSEFKYIIDGANVAYNHQNFENGKFSYRQIELVVDKMLARKDGKVLVLLPYSYAQKVVPNSSKQRGRRNISYVSVADQSIIQRFEEEGMLYLVPQGADDDWYWIYATVTEGRKNPAYVVTNDLMRDHRLAFLEPRPFIRWRTTQVANFCFSKAAREDTVDPETYIINPGKYSREIQRNTDIVDGQEVERWHIPAADRRAWLCLTTSPLSSSSTSFSALSGVSDGVSEMSNSNINKKINEEEPDFSSGISTPRKDPFVPQAPRKLF